jgi:hypothetical protein
VGRWLKGGGEFMITESKFNKKYKTEGENPIINVQLSFAQSLMVFFNKNKMLSPPQK